MKTTPTNFTMPQQKPSAADAPDSRKEETMNNDKLTILYERLSHEDGRENESLSIEHQELLCKGWSHHLIHMTAVHLWQNGT